MTDSAPRALFPGSFDPVTFGHLDLIRRAVDLFGSLRVGVFANESKKPLFAVADRVAMLREESLSLDGVTVESFGGLVVDYCRDQGIEVVVRGVRNTLDFEYERNMALMNRAMAPTVDTVLLYPSDRYAHVSSSLVREIAACGGSLDGFVPPSVAARLRGLSPSS